MALSAFDDKSHQPKEAELADRLGRSAFHWSALRARLEEELGPLSEEWNFAGAEYGWSLRLRHEKRVVLYMIPCRHHFLVGLVLGEKAVMAARASQVPADMLAAVEDARNYTEGRGVRLEVRNKEAVAGIVELALVKMRS